MIYRGSCHGPGKTLSLLSSACFVLASGLLARAIGEFRYVGFCKRAWSRFATLDTMIYSPLCLLLAIGVAAVAYLRDH